MNKTAYIYATAANGMEVRIPRDKYPQWKIAQNKIKAKKQKADRKTAEQLHSLMKKK